jgi:hypothetical protein
MATLTRDGAVNLLIPKGEKYSSLSDWDFDNAYNYDPILGAVDIDIVGNWLCNAKTIQIEYDDVDEDGNPLGLGYIVGIARKRDIDTSELSDEFPGVTAEQSGTLIIPRLLSSYSNWAFDEDESNPYVANFTISQVAQFHYHRGTWYSEKSPVGVSSDPYAIYYTEHSIEKDSARIELKYNDGDGVVNRIRTTDLTITETYY